MKMERNDGISCWQHVECVVRVFPKIDVRKIFAHTHTHTTHNPHKAMGLAIYGEKNMSLSSAPTIYE